jgi:hypothetical protein
MKKTYRFTDADLKSAWDIWNKEFNDVPVTETESEFSRMVFEAERIKHGIGRWPTVGELEAVWAEEQKKEREEWERTHAAEQAEWEEQHKRDVAVRNAK